MRTFPSAKELAAATGETLGPSDWVDIDQPLVDAFADATGDHQWIHVDPERAKAGPFGRTIAHGLLTLSLLPELLAKVYAVENVAMGVNYGFNKVRFPSPVPVGSRIRLVATVADSTGADGYVDVILRSTIEIEGASKPACVIESIARLYS